MKYVAFLDVLGFKERLRSLRHENAVAFIRSFSSTIFDSWIANKKYSEQLHGVIISDSLVISTNDVSSNSLEILLEAVVAICKNEFSGNSITIRGAIAKGPFDKLEAKELSALEKGLIVGQAYVDAYLLEGSVKTLGIMLTNDVYTDALAFDVHGRFEIGDEEMVNSEKIYVLRYLTIDFLMYGENLMRFVSLANSSKWLPHYYNALYTSLKNEDTKKVDQVFDNIISIIKGEDSSVHWRELDYFIQNTFQTDVFSRYQQRFLRYLRSHI